MGLYEDIPVGGTALDVDLTIPAVRQHLDLPAPTTTTPQILFAMAANDLVDLFEGFGWVDTGNMGDPRRRELGVLGLASLIREASSPPRGLKPIFLMIPEGVELMWLRPSGETTLHRQGGRSWRLIARGHYRPTAST